jgi:GAF domain-containing protein
MDDDPISTVARWYSALLTARDQTILECLAQEAAGRVVPAASYGVTLRRNGRPTTVANDDVRSFALNDGQNATGVGPAMEAMRTGSVVSIADLAAETRWPAYLDAARQGGLRSCLSLPLTRGEETIGSLNLYGFDHADTFGPEQEQFFVGFVRQASLTLEVMAAGNEQAAELLHRAEQQLVLQTTINRAVGIVMDQQTCDDNEALAWLQAEADRRERSPQAVAADLVAATNRSRAGRRHVVNGR